MSDEEIEAVLRQVDCDCKPSSYEEGEDDYVHFCKPIPTTIEAFRDLSRKESSDCPTTLELSSDDDQTGSSSSQESLEIGGPASDRLPGPTMETSKAAMATFGSRDGSLGTVAVPPINSSFSNQEDEKENDSAISISSRNSQTSRRSAKPSKIIGGLGSKSSKRYTQTELCRDDHIFAQDMLEESSGINRSKSHRSKKRKRSIGYGSNGSRGEGNTKPLPSSLKTRKKPVPRVNPAKKWIFTDFVSKGTRTEQWIHLLGSKLKKLAFQQELCPLSHRVHIQGCFTMTKKGRPITELKMHGAHYELQRGTDAQAVAYTQKPETRLSDGIHYQAGYAIELRLVTYDDLRPNQQLIWNMFLEFAPWDNRKVHWFYEEDGDWGKSFTTKAFLHNQTRKTLVLSGSYNDAVFAYAKFVKDNGCSPFMVIFDIPRCNQGAVSYRLIEDILNGFGFSAKYEGYMWLANSCWVLCFANERPDESKLSADRWNIVHLT